jgi:hypothetical protein
MNLLECPTVQMHHQRRQHTRSNVKIIADIRTSGGIRIKVRIVDLSQTGFQMECLAFLPEDRPVLMTLPGFAPLECNIIWRSKWHYGCAFDAPLHQAEYKNTAKEYQALLV